MKHFLISFLLVLVLKVHAQKISGEYDYFDDDSLVHYQLQINSNGTYHFSNAACLTFKESTGSWRLMTDTIILISKYQSDDINLKVKESFKENQDVDFGILRKFNGQPIPNAILFIDDDTSKWYDLLAKDYKLESLKAKSFSLFVGKYTTKKYFIKNLRANIFDIALDFDADINDYLFMKGEKLIIEKEGLRTLGEYQIVLKKALAN